ncbi:ribose-phosphate pyrophosphokinase [Candidatus Woesearchaeota archaeon]|jgi:phosphoribosylpyrophosphate synthetase|nr:ribose-phosphate pyrophosphokinase [Candidatus Woesearchaeota archaeon]MBT6518853.1 ribose-phosphate pyrophosphokinase [Candidatus Woesearchaeota archaeon]MBT7367992.1 ribose-phosphate pyrophosphokinase [Candidatus Woesearchaeota archaeon]
MRKESQSVIDDVISKINPVPISLTHIELATKISERCTGIRSPELVDAYMDPRKFSVGEFCPKFKKKVKDESVYILLMPGPYTKPESIIYKACITARAAKEAGAKKVVLLSTDLPHARQDRGSEEDAKAEGEPNTVRLHADTFKAAGIDQVITTHIHSPRIAAFFAQSYGLIPEEMKFDSNNKEIPFDANNKEIQKIGESVIKSISPHAILADYILHQSSLIRNGYLADKGAKFVLKAMDKGNREFIDLLYAALFLPNVSRVYCNKARTAKNDPKKVEVSIDSVSDNFTTLDGKLESFDDDGLDTGGTMFKAVNWSNAGNLCSETGKSFGIPEARFIYFTHAWLGGDAHQGIQERIFKNLPATEFVTTNTRPYVGDAQYYRFKMKSTILRLAGLWGDAIIANELGQDIEQRYCGFESEEQQHQFMKRLYVLKRHSSHFLNEGIEPRKRKLDFYLRE